MPCWRPRPNGNLLVGSFIETGTESAIVFFGIADGTFDAGAIAADQTHGPVTMTCGV